jgi:hypothetical protein
MAHQCITHADDMSAIILTSIWRRVCGVDLDLEGQIKSYQDYWIRNNEIEDFLDSKKATGRRRIPRLSGSLFAAPAFIRSDRIGNATPRKLGNGSANSVGDLIIVDLVRYQAEKRIAIQEIH